LTFTFPPSKPSALHQAGPNPSDSILKDPASLRQYFVQAYTAAREATFSLVEGLSPTQLHRQVHPDFSPIGWHLGHIGFTEELWLLDRLANCPLQQLTYQTPAYRRLFAADGLPKAERENLPSLSEICTALAQIRQRVLAYLEVAHLDQQAWLWYWLLQHEAQHGETITILRQLQQQTLPKFGTHPHNASPTAIPAPEMVRVAAGPFQMGCDNINALDNEGTAHLVTLPDFWIDRYPVTRGQFRQFIAAGGYQHRQWWSAAGWEWLQTHPVSQPLYWQMAEGDDHPVCGVSWYEAEAYANFVGKRLPTEAEWEKAAQANPLKPATYPWGDMPPNRHYSNHAHLVGLTTPVDQFPEGESCYGCLDMMGNVWEWTASVFAPYPDFVSFPYPGYSAAYFDDLHYVLRGGSWATRAVAMRTSFRNWYQPGTREIFAGFRCVSDATAAAQRLQLINLLEYTDTSLQTDGKELVAGLLQSPKTIPAKYFYDDQGSHLFEQICQLPEYYPTRTEAWILNQYAREIAAITGPCELVELGSGSSTKTRLLLEAYTQLPSPMMPCYLPIDVSGGILQASAQALLRDYPTLEIHGLIATYELAIAHLPDLQLPTRMIAFLGSTLGNLTPAECEHFFQQIRQALQRGQFFLLGVDLQKPIEILEAAYNDSQGITAAFNLNMLAHLNGKFSANFQLEQFQHQAFYNCQANQIEMHLISQINQTIEFAALDCALTLQAGETIRTEISRKFNLAQLSQELAQHQLAPCHIWTDPQQWFGVMLCKAV
jgi:dimethylhistidine N-methyltransferase